MCVWHNIKCCTSNVSEFYPSTVLECSPSIPSNVFGSVARAVNIWTVPSEKVSRRMKIWVNVADKRSVVASLLLGILFFVLLLLQQTRLGLQWREPKRRMFWLFCQNEQSLSLASEKQRGREREETWPQTGCLTGTSESSVSSRSWGGV